MRTIKIAYDPDLTQIGSVRVVDNDTARELVRHGRARYVEAESVPAEEALAEPVTIQADSQADAVTDAVDDAKPPKAPRVKSAVSTE